MTTEIADLHKLAPAPACTRHAIFARRFASWHEPCSAWQRRRVCAGPLAGTYESRTHPGYWAAQCPYMEAFMVEYPDTAEEAERLYAEACEWLRERLG